MDQSSMDHLALVLREMAGRFGATAFSDRPRLIAALTERLPSGSLDVGLVAAALDHGVFEKLASARPDQIGGEVAGLATKLSDDLGVRPDLAAGLVKACAFALSLDPARPAEAAPVETAGPPPVPTPQAQAHSEASAADDWVDLSGQPASPSPPAGDGWINMSGPAAAPVPGPQPAASASGSVSKTLLYVAGGVALLVFIGFQTGVIRQIPDQPPEQQQPADNPQPSSEPQGQPGGNPPEPTPAQPERRQPPAAQPQQEQLTFYGDENADFHVPPQTSLKREVGTPTPTSFPFGRTPAAVQIMDAMQKGMPVVLIDVLGDPHAQTIPGAVALPFAGQFGALNDNIQGAVVKALKTLSQGNADAPLVFFCAGVRCWESYNAALRAHAAGYTNIYWFRGGLVAWQAAGFPLQPNQ